MIDGEDSHFGFNLETLGEHGESFNEIIGKGAIASHDIFNVIFKKEVNKKADKAVAEIMAKAFILREVSARETIANDHVRSAGKDEITHFLRIGSFVSVIAIDENIAVRDDVAKHRANDIAFTLAVFMADDGAGFLSNFSGIVGRIIVIDINLSLRQSFFIIFDDFFNGFGLVITRDKNSYTLFGNIFHILIIAYL